MNTNSRTTNRSDHGLDGRLLALATAFVGLTASNIAIAVVMPTTWQLALAASFLVIAGALLLAANRSRQTSPIIAGAVVIRLADRPTRSAHAPGSSASRSIARFSHR
jgi:hypothetical protein